MNCSEDNPKPPEGPKKKRQWLKKLLAVFIGLAAGVLLAEAALRICGVSRPFFYAPDDIVGQRFRPRQEGWQDREGRAYVRINSHGWRDRERNYAKPPNTLRIAVLGDSFAEALQVTWKDAFPSIIENKLRGDGRLGGRDVEVLSLAKSGFGTAQEYLALRHYGWKYAPDIVVLAMLTGNDISDNHRSLSFDKRRPFFVLEDGELILDDSFVRSRGYRLRSGWAGCAFLWLLDHSRLAQVLWEARIRMLLRRQMQAAGAGQAVEAGLNETIYAPPESQAWKDAWAVTEAIISQMNRDIRRRGCRLLVVTLSNGFEVNPDPAQRKAYCRQQGLADLFYPNRRIDELAGREGFDVLHLGPVLQKTAERDKVCFHGFGENLGTGHWNEAGHAEAGRLIAEYIRTHMLAPKREKQPR